MRLMHIFIICVLAGCWINRDFFLENGLDKLLAKAGVSPSTIQSLSTTNAAENQTPDTPNNSIIMHAPTMTYQALPSFSGRTVNGTSRWSTEQLKGKTSVVVFFAGWCGYCKQEMPQLKALKQRFPQLHFVGVIYKDTPISARKMLLQYGNPFDELVTDNDGSAARTIGLNGVPDNFVVDSTGHVRQRVNGGITAAYRTQNLNPLIQQLLAENH